MKQQHTVTNKSDHPIKVEMDDGWHTVPAGESLTGVLRAVNNGQKRVQYSIEPFDGALGQTEDKK